MNALRSIRSLLRETIIGDAYSLYLKYFNPRKRAKKHLEKSKKIFKKEYDKYWSTIVQNKSLTNMDKQFDEIMKNGYSILPGYVSEEEIDNIKKEIWGLPGYLTGNYKGEIPCSNLPNDGITVLGVTEQLPETYKATIDNDQLHNLAKALYGTHTKLSVSSVLNKYDETKIDSASAPHWDDWRVRFKTFLYLTDVDDDNAPMIFVKGSARAGVPWRFEKDYASIFLPTASAGGSWGPVEELGLEKVSCKGKAGTLLMFVADGIHAGTQLKKEMRVMLMNMYTTHLDFTHRAY